MGLNLLPPHIRLAIAGAGLAATMAAGGLAWHLTPIIGPKARISALTDTLAKRDKTIADQVQQLQAADLSLQLRDEALKLNGQGAADEAAQASTFWRGQCRAAFEAGYASRKCTAGGAGDPGAGPGPGGVRRDLRSLWADGAYGHGETGADRLPAQPKGGD